MLGERDRNNGTKAIVSVKTDVRSAPDLCSGETDAKTQVTADGATAGAPKRLSVLGATGSIGCNTLDLVGRNEAAFDVVALTAQTNVDALAKLAIRHRAELAVIGDASHYQVLKAALAGHNIEVAAGPDALVEAASRAADIVVAAIVGAAGLRPTFAAADQGARVALANKECLVSAGDVFLRAVADGGAELLPVDSEHSAAFQALMSGPEKSIQTITLTASGGPFRTADAATLAAVTRDQALAHPTWSMGAKISIDSATMMNKGLELIEALHLFPVTADQLDVLVHPQSIIHCLVSYHDGSVLAQMGAPDMRTPISLALAWPDRMQTPVATLNLAELGQLTFEAPDPVRFPALRIAREVMAAGGCAAAVMNAANEVAVAAFLDGRIGFLDITRVVEDVIATADREGLTKAGTCLDDILSVDAASRDLTGAAIAKYN